MRTNCNKLLTELYTYVYIFPDICDKCKFEKYVYHPPQSDIEKI